MNSQVECSALAPRREVCSQSGIALVELAIIILPLILIVFSGIECASYMRQRQVAQMLSREAAIKAYKRCSGFELPRAGDIDTGRSGQCLADIVSDLRTISGAATTANFDIGLYRCDPADDDAQCSTPSLAASVGDVGLFTTKLNVNGDEFRNLVISQRAAIAVRVSISYRSPLFDSALYAGLSVLQLGVVSDVTVL